jgi:hypothetical protein
MLSRHGAAARTETPPSKEFLMNRIFSTIAIQSVIAAAVVTAAPLAQADSVSDPLAGVPTSTVADRAEVRRLAIEARDQRLASGAGVETLLDPTSAPFVSTANRGRVHAEAVEAARLGLTGSYDGKPIATPAQLAQIERAGQRVDGNDLMAVKR